MDATVYVQSILGNARKITFSQTALGKSKSREKFSQRNRQIGTQTNISARIKLCEVCDKMCQVVSEDSGFSFRLTTHEAHGHIFSTDSK